MTVKCKAFSSRAGLAGTGHGERDISSGKGGPRLNDSRWVRRDRAEQSRRDGAIRTTLDKIGLEWTRGMGQDGPGGTGGRAKDRYRRLESNGKR